MAKTAPTRAAILSSVSTWLRLLALIVLVAEAMFFVAMKFGPEEDRLKGWYPLIMLAFLLVIVVGLFVDRHLQATSRKRPSALEAKGSLPIKRSRWFTRWSLGTKVYNEALEVAEDSGGCITGIRTVAVENSGKMDTYQVIGTRRGAFLWLEYHLDEGGGGGAIVLHEFTPGKLRGAILSADCDSGSLKCNSNIWVSKEELADYRRDWQQALGQLQVT